MPNKKEMVMYSHRGRPLILAGAILTLIGFLRFYNVDWNIVLIILGLVLLAKGCWIKTKTK